MQNTVFPAIYGSIAVLLSIPFYYFGLRFFGSKGIALAISLSGILQVLVLYMLWNKRSYNQGSRQVYIFYAKMIFFSALLFPILSWFKTNVLIAVNPAIFSGSILMILLTGVTFTLIMGLVAYSLKIKEITDVAGKIVTHLKRVITPQ
jgi:putative peptidoglycan lipid II flippase